MRGQTRLFLAVCVLLLVPGLSWGQGLSDADRQWLAENSLDREGFLEIFRRYPEIDDVELIQLLAFRDGAFGNQSINFFSVQDNDVGYLKYALSALSPNTESWLGTYTNWKSLNEFERRRYRDEYELKLGELKQAIDDRVEGAWFSFSNHIGLGPYNFQENYFPILRLRTGISSGLNRNEAQEPTARIGQPMSYHNRVRFHHVFDMNPVLVNLSMPPDEAESFLAKFGREPMFHIVAEPASIEVDGDQLKAIQWRSLCFMLTNREGDALFYGANGRDDLLPCKLFNFFQHKNSQISIRELSMSYR